MPVQVTEWSDAMFMSLAAAMEVLRLTDEQ